MYTLHRQVVRLLPGEERGHNPSEEADEDGPGLGAHVAGLQGLTDGVVALEGYRQDGQDTGVGDGQLDKGNGLTWNGAGEREGE